MKQETILKIILVLLIVGFLSVLVLSAIQIKTGNLCPPIFGIPACYVLLFTISSAIISHLKLVNDRQILFLIGIGITLVIASYASYYQIIDLLECPKEPILQTPMCYLSFFLFSVIFVLKIAEIKHEQI